MFVHALKQGFTITTIVNFPNVTIWIQSTQVGAQSKLTLIMAWM